jgi:hypothetical protein
MYPISRLAGRKKIVVAAALFAPIEAAYWTQSGTGGLGSGTMTYTPATNVHDERPRRRPQRRRRQLHLQRQALLMHRCARSRTSASTRWCRMACTCGHASRPEDARRPAFDDDEFVVSGRHQ